MIGKMSCNQRSMRTTAKDVKEAVQPVARLARDNVDVGEADDGPEHVNDRVADKTRP